MSKSIDDLLNEWGLTSEHEIARKTIPPYAYKMEELVARVGSDRPGTPPPRKKQRLDEIVDDLNRRWTQAQLFTDEELPQRPIEELIAALEAVLPSVLFVDAELGEVTIRGAAASRNLWERAIKAIHEFALSQRVAADKINRCVKIAMEIAKRIKD
jgi:hypothetical protein